MRSHGPGFDAAWRVLARCMSAARGVAGRKRTDGRQRHDSPGRACRPWRIRSFTDAAPPGALAQSGLRFRDIVVNVEPLRAIAGDPTAAWMEQALERRLCLRPSGPHLAPGDRGAPSSRGPDRLDLSRPEPRRARARGLGAGHDHRKLPRSGAAGRNRAGNPAAGDRVLLSERRRPGARRDEPITGASISPGRRSSPAGRRGSFGL